MFNWLKPKYLRCPRCKKPMDILTREGITIDKCPSCEGIWLDKGELEHISKRNHGKNK